MLKNIAIMAGVNAALLGAFEAITYNRKPEEPDVKTVPAKVLTVSELTAPTPTPTPKPEPRMFHDPRYDFHQNHRGEIHVLISKGLYRIGENTPYGQLLAAAPDGALFRSAMGEVMVTPHQWNDDPPERGGEDRHVLSIK